MTKLDERTTANMNVAPENACRVLPNSGGDHEARKYIAKKLLQAANKGERTLGALEAVARRGLQELPIESRLENNLALLRPDKLVMDVLRPDPVCSLHRRQASDRGDCHARNTKRH